MKKLIILVFSVLSIAVHPVSAQRNEDSGNFKYYKAQELLEKGGDPMEARELVEENIRENPRHIDSYLLIVNIDRREGDYSSALRMVELAMKNNHKHSGFTEAVLLWWKAVIYDELGDTGKAVELMEQTLKLAKKQSKEHLCAMMDDLAHYYFESGDYDASDALYREIMKQDESALSPMIGLARNLNARGKYDEALAMLDECAKYDKNYAEINRYRMYVYREKKEYKRMIDEMMALYDKSDDPDDLNMSNFKKDMKYSVAVIKERIASEKDNSFWRFVLASLYEESRQYSRMLPLLDDLLAEYGADVDLLLARADCYDEMGVPELALADINKILEICDESELAYFYARRADIHRFAGNYKEAIEDMTKYIDRYPTDVYGYYARGWCKELSGDLEGAMEDYDEGIAVDEDYPYIYLMRGSLLLKNGKKEMADLDFNEVVAKDTVVTDGSCRHYALNFLGKPDEALEWMEKVIALDVDAPGNWYDKACLLARMDRCDESVKALEVAFQKGYRSFPHIQHDDDLDPIRDREDFKALIAKYEQVLADELAKVGKTLEQESEKVVTEVDMKRMYGGTYEVSCSVNGLPLKMIFDTGAADVTISSVEANFMLKNGYLSESDIKGKRNYVTASGDIHEGTILRLKEVKLGDAVLKNIEASVVHSQKAPLLLGQSVLEKFGTITIDNVNSKLLIKQ